MIYDISHCILGEEFESLDFHFSENSEVHNSCGIVFNNSYFVFGGETYPTQVQKRKEKKDKISLTYR